MTTDGLRALTTLDTATSHRVKLLRFPLILLVLYIHCYLAPVRLGSSTIAVAPAMWLITLQAAWSNGFARTAVPLFFLMSGYLYWDCQDFRVWVGIMGKKEIPYVPTQRACDSERASRPASGGGCGQCRI